MLCNTVGTCHDQDCHSGALRKRAMYIHGYLMLSTIHVTQGGYQSEWDH